MKKHLSVLLVVIMVGCSETEQPVSDRWYTSAQIDKGAEIYENNCASCHGDEAQGTVSDWKQPLADGSYPPPPLNGSAHAAHHPFEMLQQTILEGGAPFGGTMPSFKDKLSEQEINSTIAYFQSKWSDELYKGWDKGGGH